MIQKKLMVRTSMELTFMKDKSRKQIEEFARRLQDEIFEVTNLVGSVGIARSKTYAKLSSGLDKSKGITTILTGEDERTEIYPLPVNKVWGVGSRRHEHILAEGYKTIGDVADKGKVKTFQRLFGSNFGKMLFQTITGKDQGRVMEELVDYKPKHGISYGHTFSEGCSEVDRIKGEFAIAIQHLCYRMRAFGIRANSYSGVFGFNKQDLPSVGFRFVTDGFTNIDDYIFDSCMQKVMPAIEKVSSQGMEIRNIILSTHKIDKTDQMNLFFADEQEHVARYKAIDEIKNRFECFKDKVVRNTGSFWIYFDKSRHSVELQNNLWGKDINEVIY